MSDQTADPFATPPAEAADPFAGVEPDLSEPSEEIAAETPAADIPTVDREGEPVEAAADEAEVPAEEPAAEPAVEEPAVEPESAPEAPQEPEPPVEAPVAPQEPVEAPQEPQPTTPEAEAPDAPTNGPRGGKGEMRHYKLLYQTGPAQWTEFDLSGVQIDGISIVALAEKVKEGEPPRSELWIEARNNDHANRLSFTILGRPQDGVRAFPVPRGAWKPKTIKPAPPKPERESLVIQ